MFLNYAQRYKHLLIETSWKNVLCFFLYRIDAIWLSVSHFFTKGMHIAYFPFLQQNGSVCLQAGAQFFLKGTSLQQGGVKMQIPFPLVCVCVQRHLRFRHGFFGVFLSWYFVSHICFSLRINYYRLVHLYVCHVDFSEKYWSRRDSNPHLHNAWTNHVFIYTSFMT